MSELAWPSGEPVDVETVSTYTEQARVVALPPDDGVIRTPDWAIEELARVSRWAASMIVVIAKAEELKRATSADLADARADAVLAVSEFPERERASRVVLATRDQRAAYDRAAVAFEEARRVGNLLKQYSIRVQSIANLVKLTYQQGGA